MTLRVDQTDALTTTGNHAADHVATNTQVNTNTAAIATNTASIATNASNLASEISRATTAEALKQATLVSGTNIKTINSTSLLGSGDIAIAGGTDATTLAKGIVQLAGDLGGTAALPTVPGLAAKAADSAVVHNTGTENVGGVKTFTSNTVLNANVSIPTHGSTLGNSLAYTTFRTDNSGMIEQRGNFYDVYTNFFRIQTAILELRNDANQFLGKAYQNYANAATSGATMQNAGAYEHWNRYWNGSSSLDHIIKWVPTLLTTTPTSKLSLKFDGTEKLSIGSDGTLTTVGGANMGGATVIDTTNTNPFKLIDTTAYQNAIPVMSSNTTPSGFVITPSTEANSSNAGFMAFNGDLTDQWTASTTTGFLKVDFGSGNTKTIKQYSITGPQSGQSTYGPNAWTLAGSNDDSTYTTLDTQTAITGWGTLEVRTYTFTNTTAYRYYKWNVTANNGGIFLSIAALALNVLGKLLINVKADKVAIGQNNDPIETLDVGGKIRMASGTPTITSPGASLILEETGDTFGTSRLTMMNRSGQNGPLFEVTNSSVPLDFGFKHPSYTRAIRLEARAGSGKAGDPSWHIGGSNVDDPTIAVGDVYLYMRRAVRYAYAAKTTTYTITTSDSVIDCTSGTFTVTLPTAVGFSGLQYTIKNSGTGVITIATTSSQTIDGGTTASLAVQYVSLTVVSNGANWIVI
jgi:hypothetical protein